MPNRRIHATTEPSPSAECAIRFLNGGPFTTATEHDEALTLIRRLLATTGIDISAQNASSVALEPLTGGRSGAHIFKLTPLIDPERHVTAPPVVVKIAPREEGASEKANFDEFARPVLPSSWRPELLGFAQTTENAALCYSFVGNQDGTRGRTLTDHLQDGDVGELDAFLARMLALLRGTWHSPRVIRREQDLARRYLSRHFVRAGSIAAAEAALNLCAARYFDARQGQGEWLIGATGFPSPAAALFAAERRYPYRSCIVHGDFNSDNIIIARDRTCPALVDFRRTGRGHVYEDFVALEASVRINHPSNASFSEIFEREGWIALGRQELRETAYTASILNIRDAAIDRFGCVEDDVTYHFAVAAVGLRLMQATDLSDAARARVTASVFWATKALTMDVPISCDHGSRTGHTTRRQDDPRSRMGNEKGAIRMTPAQVVETTMMGRGSQADGKSPVHP